MLISKPPFKFIYCYRCLLWFVLFQRHRSKSYQGFCKHFSNAKRFRGQINSATVFKSKGMQRAGQAAGIGQMRTGGQRRLADM